MRFIFLIALIIIVVITLALTKRVETYAYYMETLGMPMYNLLPSNFNVFLINLDVKPERLDNFIEAYKRTDLYNVKRFERVAAVNGRQLNLSKHVSYRGQQDIEMIEQQGYRIRHNQLTRGAVGCYLSHINVYKMIRDRPEEFGIIFEDDVKFNQRNIYKHLRIQMAKIPDDWDILLLGCVCHICKHNDGYKDLNHFFLLHAYVVKKSSAINILKELEFLPVRQQIDSELSVLAIEKKIKVYCLTSSLVWQDPKINATSIQTPLKIIPGVNPYSLI
jgi:GR25 family glycosyltransferase involved in LPS biosynthesis